LHTARIGRSIIRSGVTERRPIETGHGHALATRARAQCESRGHRSWKLDGLDRFAEPVRAVGDRRDGGVALIGIHSWG
jgi:hypothetical protein